MDSDSYLDLKNYINSHKEVYDFFNSYSAIDQDSLVSKVFEIYTKALKVHSYRCIQTYKFLSPRIINNPFYSSVIHRSTPFKFLDVGCALGTDLRKIALDGIPQENLFGLDIEKNFVQLGYNLFNDKNTSNMCSIG